MAWNDARGSTGSPTLLQLDLECSRCGRRPRRRIYPLMKEMMYRLDDDDPVETWRCHGCGEFHVVTAGAYKRAG